MYKGGNGLGISFRETLLYLISYQLRMKKSQPAYTYNNAHLTLTQGF